MAETKHRDVEGIKWGEGTICNAKWTGIRLRDIILRAGLDSAYNDKTKLHVCFASHVAKCQEDDWFGSSVPLEKAIDPNGDVILAYEVR